MRGTIHQAVERARLLVLAVVLLFFCVPTAQALRSPTPLPSLGWSRSGQQLKEENGPLQKTALFEKTALTPENQGVAAKSRTRSLNPFGRLIAEWGPMATVNEMQFSSMPVNRLSGMPHFLRREYEPDWDGWLQRDPIGEAGGINLYRFVGNSPLAFGDPYGLDFHAVGSYGLFAPGPVSYLSGDTDLEALGAGMYDILPEAENVALDAAAGAASLVKGLFDLLDWGSEQSGLTGLMGASPSDTLTAMPFVVPELGLLDFALRSVKPGCRADSSPQQRNPFVKSATIPSCAEFGSCCGLKSARRVPKNVQVASCSWVSYG